MNALVLCVAVGLASGSSHAVSPTETAVKGASPSVWPSIWVWLSGKTDTALKQLVAHSRIVDAVCMGGWSVDAAGTFHSSPNMTLAKTLISMGVEVHGLMGIASMQAMRTLTGCTLQGCPTVPRAAMTSFIDEAVSSAIATNITGYNLDFEPYGDHSLTNADGVVYGYFVELLSLSLHQKGIALSVDYFTNLPVWNLPYLNGTAVNRLISMDTYVQPNATFEAYFAVATAYIDPRKLGVGMCAVVSPTGKPYGPDPCGRAMWSAAMVAERFAFLRVAAEERRFAQINMWVMPLPDVWWGALEDFVSYGRGRGRAISGRLE